MLPVVGCYAWFDGGVVQVLPSGALAQTGISGGPYFATWTDNNGTYSFNWTNGFTDTLTMTATGGLSGMNNVGGTVTGTPTACPSSSDPVVGCYAWFDGGVVQVLAGGVVVQTGLSSFFHATWVDNNGTYSLSWSNGYNDTLTRTASGVLTGGNGNTMTFGTPTACPVCTMSSSSSSSASSSGCVPQCSGKQCGPDGCGGMCGSCPNACNNGQCTGTCAPGSHQCAGNSIQTCEAGGTWQTTTTCGANQTCSNNQCVAGCSTETIEFVNNIGNLAGICGSTPYALESEMFITTVTMPGQVFQVGYLQSTTDNLALGQSDSGKYQCCMVDPLGCVGYKQKCNTNQGTLGCVCTAWTNWSVTANSCAMQTLPLCH